MCELGRSHDIDPAFQSARKNKEAFAAHVQSGELSLRKTHRREQEVASNSLLCERGGPAKAGGWCSQERRGVRARLEEAA